MNPKPTGTISKVATDRHDLALTRTFRTDAADVWASITDPERTARWYGRWEGEPGTGHTVRVQLGFEEGQPWEEVRIEACVPNEKLTLTTTDGTDEWHFELTLAEADGETTLTFVQQLTDPTIASGVGPGWEWYLDKLVASRGGEEPGPFEEYYPAQSEYYTEQARASLES